VNTSAIDEIARRRGRKHAGLAIGVDLDGETSTFGRGRIGPDRPQSPAADTIFEIGSITKVFTATLLADMAEEGLVALDDPVQRYLPDDVRLPVRGRPITLVDLATPRARDPRDARAADAGQGRRQHRARLVQDAAEGLRPRCPLARRRNRRLPLHRGRARRRDGS
jgi:CubicO group peptidase (beta-lactamase class C family)